MAGFRNADKTSTSKLKACVTYPSETRRREEKSVDTEHCEYCYPVNQLMGYVTYSTVSGTSSIAREI